jgi:hypothetical protein
MVFDRNFSLDFLLNFSTVDVIADVFERSIAKAKADNIAIYG